MSFQNRVIDLSYVYTVHHQYPTRTDDNPYRYQPCQDWYIGKAQVIRWLEAIRIFPEEMPENIIAECCIDVTDDCSYQYIAKIMHSQIHSGVAGYQRPKTEKQSQFTSQKKPFPMHWLHGMKEIHRLHHDTPEQYEPSGKSDCRDCSGAFFLS